jgi:transcriptional regulator with XRE-family HTH domain
MQDQVTALVAGAVNGLAGLECEDERLTAVAAAISGAVLRRVRAGFGESRQAFAARAGVPAAAVAGAEDGSCPAWMLPYDQYQAIEAAVSVLNPGLAEVFYVAAACDLFLTALLKGDDETEDAALAGLRGQHASMAWSLLIWAVSGVLDGKAREYLTVPSSAPLLPAGVLAELAGLYVAVLIDGCGCSGSQL